MIMEQQSPDVTTAIRATMITHSTDHSVRECSSGKPRRSIYTSSTTTSSSFHHHFILPRIRHGRTHTWT